MLLVCMMLLKFCHQRTNGRTDEQGDSRSRIENMKWAAELKVGRNVKVAEM